MHKKRYLIVALIFFLLLDASSSSILSAAGCLLPEMKLGQNCPDVSFKKIYESVCFGLALYKSDVIGRRPKEELIKDASTAALGPGIIFDLENIDAVRKGWTRYYPFSIDGKDFIMRIFLTEELRFQPDAPVLYEGSISFPAVTFQVLPSLNEILSTCKIKPHKTYFSLEAARSP